MACGAHGGGRTTRPWAGKVGAVGAVVLVAAVLSGCVPKFDAGAELSVSPYGMAMRIEWPAAADPDGGSIESYRIDVDGVEVARRSASLRHCDLAGLAEGPHEVTVTAYDVAGEWSGAAAASGAVSVTVTPGVIAPEGAEPGCQPVYEAAPLDVGTGRTWYVDVSADGRHVAFITDAASVPGGGGSDDNGTLDVFYRDLATGITTRITDGDDRSDSLAISDDGRYVAFHSGASNLVADDTNATSDVFVWDRDTATITIVDPGSGSAGGEGLAMSGDGRFVGYVTDSGLDPLDTNTSLDAYLWDRSTGTSVLSAGTAGFSGWAWDVSPSGRMVIYEHGTETEGRRAYLWDRVTGERHVIPERGDEYWPRTTDDGQVVVYSYLGAVYRWVRASGVSTALSHPWTQSQTPMLSSDGSTVVFPTLQADLTGAPMPATNSFALFDAATGSTSWVAPAGGPYPRMNADASVIVTTNWPGPGAVILRRVD